MLLSVWISTPENWVADENQLFPCLFQGWLRFEVILISSFWRQSTSNNVDCSEITTKSLFDGCSVAWNWLVLRNGKSLLNKKWKFCHQMLRNLGSFQMTNNIFWIIANYLPPPPLAVWVIKWPPSYPRKTH